MLSLEIRLRLRLHLPLHQLNRGLVMATENASYISEFNTAYPADGDAVGEGGGTTTGTGSTRWMDVRPLLMN